MKECKPKERVSYSSTTDKKGIICSVSEELCKISGYDKEELIGQNHSILRDPSMPKIIFELMWETIESGHIFIGYIRNKTKDGNYYWMSHKVHSFSKSKDGTCYYISHKTPMSSRAKHYMTTWYEKLLLEEHKGGVDASRVYMQAYLDYRGVNFNEYMETFLDAGGLLKVGYFMARKILS
ncbi:MAG: PAS domain S-box protein [Sulfurimonas sp.]|nr:PAS domain S-box protein [Sulfurimonas sp.]